MPKKELKISKKNLEKAAKNSSKMEGIIYKGPKKNAFVIKLLKKHGHTFSI